MNRDIKKIKVYHQENGNIDWWETGLTLFGCAALIVVFHLIGAI